MQKKLLADREEMKSYPTNLYPQYATISRYFRSVFRFMMQRLMFRISNSKMSHTNAELVCIPSCSGVNLKKKQIWINGKYDLSSSKCFNLFLCCEYPVYFRGEIKLDSLKKYIYQHDKKYQYQFFFHSFNSSTHLRFFHAFL